MHLHVNILFISYVLILMILAIKSGGNVDTNTCDQKENCEPNTAKSYEQNPTSGYGSQGLQSRNVDDATSKVDKNHEVEWRHHVLKENGYVRDCITSNIVRSYDLKSVKAEMIELQAGSSKESWAQREESFLDVFWSRAWGDSGIADGGKTGSSGKGSTLLWAQEIVATLHSIIPMLKQSLGKQRLKVLDVGCGDMVWMVRFLQTRDDIIYNGVDIVKPLIKQHKEKYINYTWTFEARDVLIDPIQTPYDLILCRMVLQHLYLHDALKLIKSFSDSQSSYLIMTTFPHEAVNVELSADDFYNPGRYQPVNMELTPFALLPPLCMSRDGPPDEDEAWEHYIGLWKLPLKQVQECDEPQLGKLSGLGHRTYACTPYTLLTVNDRNY